MRVGDNLGQIIELRSGGILDIFSIPASTCLARQHPTIWRCCKSKCRDSFELRYGHQGIGGDVRNRDSAVSAVLGLFSNCKVAQTKREIL